jgi:hypothetical protein
MTLQTFEEEEILHRIRRIEKALDALFIMCAEILGDVQPRYQPTVSVTVTPRSTQAQPLTL